MPKLFVLRVLLGLTVVASLGIASATPALASGTANWQVTFSGTTALVSASRDRASWPVPRALVRRAWRLPGTRGTAISPSTSTMFPAFPRVPVR